jgi:hypothetical protein
LNGSGPYGCTDCLNTSLDHQAFVGGMEGALNDAYAEGRKDEAEELSAPWVNVRECGWHHYTPENIDAIIRDLKLVERGDKPDPWLNGDIRTRCGILWRVISALSHEVPLNPEPVTASDKP